jgi:Protein of unknown function (DUF1194)
MWSFPFGTAPRLRTLTAILGLACAALPVAPALAGQRCVDLRLVLAIDGSGSIDTGEYAMQLDGYARALQDPQVTAAIRAVGTVEIGAIIWGDDRDGVLVLPLRRADQPAGLADLIHDLSAAPRRTGGNTGIGRAVVSAVQMVQKGRCADRLVINVSGDGRESAPPRDGVRVALAQARTVAEAAGVTINGLSILNEDAALDVYYQYELITGPGAFVISVQDFDSFAEALITKLDREIRPPALAWAGP